MSFDDLDSKILRALSENSRLSLRKMAKKVGKSVGTVMSRIGVLEKSGTIRKYSILVDYDKLGFDLQAIVKINVAKGKLFEVEKKIASHPNVCAVYDVTGATDVLVIARFKTKNALDKFLKNIQTFDFVENTETSIILNTLKEEPVGF